jgi:hypothetical protein
VVVFVYAFETILMRAITAIFLLSALGSLACANRGMQAPTDGGPGVAGRGGTAGRGGAGGTAGRGGSGGSGRGGTGGGPTGVAGTGGQTSGTAGNCNLAATDGGAGGACGTMFNFETGVQGATINAGSLAFTNLARSGTFTFCGGGALALTALFSGTSGPTIKGEVLINLPGAPVDLTNKTITVHVASDPGCSSDLYLSMVVNTQVGPIYFSPPVQVRPVTSSWQTGTATVTADAGSTSALALSLQFISATNFQGTVYIDEIDIR